jgi:hypothetical protein
MDVFANANPAPVARGQNQSAIKESLVEIGEV